METRDVERRGGRSLAASLASTLFRGALGRGALRLPASASLVLSHDITREHFYHMTLHALRQHCSLVSARAKPGTGEERKGKRGIGEQKEARRAKRAAAAATKPTVFNV